ncbi:hypothetical protein FSP39_025073 [Pinctada imbricata]|uniref:B box-type domain-containing protein n=1 Tax=Pinctada imbricata TaxID=66713 RepID=A0AA89BMK8_PINIB|nr:hypothetical protein FSP39_025073 [Pinctada imbricata]
MSITDNIEHSKDKETAAVCDICRHKKEFNTATYFCIICRFLFCANCADCHRELPISKDHFLIRFDVSETSNSSLFSILDSIKGTKTIETDTVDSDFIYLEEKCDIPASDEKTGKPLFDELQEKAIEGNQASRVIVVGETIRKLISLPDGRLIVQLNTRILLFSKEYVILTEMDSPRNGHLVQTSSKGFAIVAPSSITEVSISDQKNLKMTNVVQVKSALPASILDVSYDDGVYFVIVCRQEGKDIPVTNLKSSSKSQHDEGDTKCTRCLDLHVLYKDGNLITHSQPMLGYTKELEEGNISCVAAKRRVFVSTDDGIFCISMYGEVVAHMPSFKHIVENPYARVSAICVDDDTVFQVVNEESPESSVCHLHAVHITTKETRKYRLDSNIGLNNGKRLGAMAMQKSRHRVVLQNGDNIEVSDFGDGNISP